MSRLFVSLLHFVISLFRFHVSLFRFVVSLSSRYFNFSVSSRSRPQSPEGLARDRCCSLIVFFFSEMGWYVGVGAGSVRGRGVGTWTSRKIYKIKIMRISN